MPAPRDPAGYGFQFVLEYPGLLDPRIAYRVSTYSEPARQTRNIRLLGKQRPLVFVRDKGTRDRCFKLGWTDRTAEFHREWSEADGSWVHREPAKDPEPIRAPDRPQEPLPASPTDGVESAIKALDLTPVKRLVPALAGGQFDDHLTAMLAHERAKPKPRSGAVSAIATRIGSLPRS